MRYQTNFQNSEIFIYKKILNLQTIIIEGKKETLIDRYKDNLDIDNWVKIIEEVIDSDPTSTKKYSEYVIKEIIRLSKETRNFTDNGISGLMYIIRDFHNLNQKIDQDVITSFFNKMSSYRNNGIYYFNSESEENRVKQNPKDINSYPNIYAAQIMTMTITEINKDKETRKKAKSESEKIFENDTYLIVRPLTYAASCYYGAATKWCTASNQSDNHFNSITREGNLYYIINKKSKSSQFGKMALLVKSDGSTEVFDQQDAERTMHHLLELFPDLKEQIKRLTRLAGVNYHTLKELQNGTIQSTSLKSDGFISRVYPNSKTYMLEVDFNDGFSDFIKLFDTQLEKYEIQELENYWYHHYGKSEFYDPYSFDDDLTEGYYFNYFTSDMVEKLTEILNVVDPKLATCLNSQEYNQECLVSIGDVIKRVYPKHIDDLAYVFADAKNSELESAINKEILDVGFTVLEPLGFETTDRSVFYTYTVSLEDVLALYDKVDEDMKDTSVYSVLKQVLDDMDSFPLVNFSDNIYEYSDDKAFTESFVEPTMKILDEMLEDIEGSDYFKDIDGYLETIKVLIDKYNYDKYDEEKYMRVLDHDNIFLKVLGVDPETNKIKFEVLKMDANGNNRTKTGTAKLSTINSIINNYSLFDFFED